MVYDVHLVQFHGPNAPTKWVYGIEADTLSDAVVIARQRTGWWTAMLTSGWSRYPQPRPGTAAIAER